MLLIIKALLVFAISNDYDCKKQYFMKTYQVMVSPKPFNRKPSKEEIPSIKASFITTGVTIDQMVEHVSQPKGYTYMPAIITSKSRISKNWEEQQTFFLDFESGITMDEVKKRFAEFDITPNFFYTTFSHTNEAPRFRAVILVDELITDATVCDRIRGSLKKLFPEADQSCFDRPRMFHGGNDSFVVTDLPTPLSKLTTLANLVNIVHDHGKSRNFVSKGVSLLNDNRDSRFQTNLESYQEYLHSLGNRTADFNLLSSKVKIFNDFVNGKWLYHDELLGIATSLHWLKGGRKFFKEIMEKHNRLGNTHYSIYKMAMCDYACKMEYLPRNLANYSPYPEDHSYSTLVSALWHPTGIIERISTPETISLAEAETKFEEAFKQALAAPDNKIYIFKLPTGFGKSTQLTKLKGHLIAFPTHKLKDEINKKMVYAAKVSPGIPTFTSLELNRIIKKYYDMGLNEAVHRVVQSVAEQSDPRSSDLDAQLALNYLEALQFRTTPDTNLLTTHQRALLANYPDDCILFDEDPIKDLLAVQSTTIKDLMMLNECLPEEWKIRCLLDDLKNAEPGRVYPVNKPPYEREVLIRTIATNPLGSNVLQMLNSVAFIRPSQKSDVINYIVRRELDFEKKHIILSATAQVHLYERLYPGRVEVMDLTNIPLKGEVIQHINRSYSRSSLTKEVIQELKEDLGNVHLITFKNIKELFPQANSEMHHGNVLGFNKFEGDDIAVVGTPHMNEVVYRLMAFAVGIDPNLEGQLKTRQVRYGDFQFSFKTFESPLMQQIQLSLIEAELIQAVGRARALREDSVVKLYSNLPLSFSTFVENKVLKEPQQAFA